MVLDVDLHVGDAKVSGRLSVQDLLGYLIVVRVTFADQHGV
jgi:hypothetical protein